MWRGMASPTLSGKHSHRGVVQRVVLSVAGSNLLRSGQSVNLAHPFWREPRAPVLLLEQAGACDQQKMIYPCSYFLGARLLMVRHHMDRAAPAAPAATWAGAGGKGRSRRCAVHWHLQQRQAQTEAGEQHARGPFGFAPPNGARVCNPPAATWACACGERGAAGAARSVVLLQRGSALADTGEQHARGPFELPSVPSCKPFKPR
jgi:hypothetical protein